MKQLWITRTGEPSVLQVREKEDPEPGPGEVRVAVEAANLLEIGKLANLHTIAPDFPAQSPGAQGRAFPIVLNKPDIVLQWINPKRP